MGSIWVSEGHGYFLKWIKNHKLDLVSLRWACPADKDRALVGVTD